MIVRRSLPLLLVGLISVIPTPTLADARPAESDAQFELRDGYSLAFSDADVRGVVDAVLGSMLGVNYSVDPAVTGNVTLRTAEPVPKESLLPLLEAALRSIDAVIVIEDSNYWVLPAKKARPHVTFESVDDPARIPPGYTSEVITLKNASAKEVARLMSQFLGKEIVSGVDADYNQIIVTGTYPEREAAHKLIDRFDVDAMAAMNFEIFKLENVDARVLVGELSRIFRPPFDIIGTRVRLVPLPRLRSVLAIGAARADLAKIAPWVRRLDTGVSGKRKLYSYTVQNGRARDLARSLQLVLGQSVGMTNDEALPDETLPTMLGERGANEPSDVIAPETPLPGSASDIPPAVGGPGPRIVPNEANNSILIFADGEEYDFIREALERLDQPVPQVLIEATLAEVTLTNEFRFGVDFSVISGNTTITSSTNKTGIPSSVFPGFSLSVLGSSADAVLNSLQAKTNVRVLSAPKLLVLNNQTATLQVGDQVPIVTQQSQSVAAPGAPIVNNVELRDTGVILKVTPRVNDSGTVTLDIAQEVSDVAETTTSGINSPTIQQRRLASTVSTRSGQMIALGGLIRNKLTKTKSGIPLLSQIPLVGGLFGSHSNTGSRTELIILLTPTVVRSPAEMKQTVNALIEGLDAVQPIVRQAAQSEVRAHATPQ